MAMATTTLDIGMMVMVNYLEWLWPTCFWGYLCGPHVHRILPIIRTKEALCSKNQDDSLSTDFRRIRPPIILLVYSSNGALATSNLLQILLHRDKVYTLQTCIIDYYSLEVRWCRV